MEEKKLVKITRYYDDGTEDYVAGKDLINLLKNEHTGCVLSATHGMIPEKVEWKKVE